MQPIAPQMMPAMAMPLPPPSPPDFETAFSPMMPKMIASSGATTVQPAGMPMMPSTSDATHQPLLCPAASSVVPSIVNGMPQLLQLFAVIGDMLPHRGH